MKAHHVEAALNAAFRMPEGFLVLSAELSAEERAAGLHTLVLAYAAADKAHSSERTLPAWLSTLDGTLAKIGWATFSGSSSEFESTEVRDVTEGVSRDLPGVLGEAARLSVASAFDGLLEDAKGATKPPIEARVHHFSSVWRDAGTVRMSVARVLGEVRVEEKPGVGQGSRIVSRVHYRWRTLGMILNRDVYAQVKDAVASKVEPVLSRFAVPAPLPGAESISTEEGIAG